MMKNGNWQVCTALGGNLWPNEAINLTTPNLIVAKLERECGIMSINSMVARRRLHFKEGKSNIIYFKLSQEVAAVVLFHNNKSRRTGATQQHRINSGEQDKHNQLYTDVRMDRNE